MPEALTDIVNATPPFGHLLLCFSTGKLFLVNKQLG